MTFLALVEDRPTPPSVYNWRVYVCAAIASFASMTIGYDSAFIGTTLALPSFTKEFDFAAYSPSDLALVKANIVSIYQAGAFFGSFLAYAVAHFFGRKHGLVAFSTTFIIGAAIMLGANGARGLGLIYAGRVLTGLGVGGASMLTPIYISEIAPPAVRGRLVGLYELGWQFGGLVGFWINYGISENIPQSTTSWLIPFAVQLIPAGFLFVGSFWIKESPRWLYLKGRREIALRNLCWIRQLTPSDLYIVEEVMAIDLAIEHQRSNVGLGFWQPFRAVARDRKVLWRFFIGGMLFLWQNGTGINAINYYSPTVFQSIGIVGTNSAFLTTGIFGVVKTAITFVWLFLLIDHLGRRNLLLFGSFGGSLCMWFIAAYIKVAGADPKNTNTNLSSGGVAAIFFFYLWTAIYTPTWNGTPWVINAEMFQPNVRALGQASAAANNWLWNFLISRFTPQMFLTMGYGVYMFFATMMILSIPFVFFLIPDTKSVPLEAMDRLFEVRPVWRANKLVLSELQNEEEIFRRDTDGVELTAEKTKLEHIEHAEV
ncbi:hypothetical protein MMC10_000995 [Thelotrema lepadinum]|nr:hypothetical protein [Thelotrema lepadinum]